MGIWGKLHHYKPSHCIWIFLKYNSLRSNDASASYIIIVEIMASHLLGHYLNQFYPRRIANLTRGTNVGGGGGGGPHGFKVQAPYPRPIFLPTPAPLFPYFSFGYGAPPKIQIFWHHPPPIWPHHHHHHHHHHHAHVDFCGWKKSAITFGEGCMKMSSAKCRLFGLGLSVWLVDMIWRRIYYALLLCVQNCCTLFQEATCAVSLTSTHEIAFSIL